MRLSQFVAAAALGAAAVAPAAPRPNAAEAAGLERVSARGALLFEVDRAAWVTTDDMLAKLGTNRDVPIKGWVVERDGAAPRAYVVTYFGDGPAGRVAWYVGRVRDNRLVSGELLRAASRPPLTPDQARLAEAVWAARTQTELRPCTAEPFNVAALPPQGPDAPIDVYLLTSTSENGLYPMGGHYLLRIAPGGKIVSSRKFTNACLNMREQAGPNGEKPVGLGVAHFLDPIPTEIHVFMSMWARKPVFVITGKRTWLVDGPKISLLKS